MFKKESLIIDVNNKSILDFLLERDKIRIQKENNLPKPWTNDQCLANSRFLNVFREDDKVSKIIFDNAPNEDLIYEYVYITRFINHAERLEWLLQDLEWLKSKETVKDKMQEFVDLGLTVCNVKAYQIHPQIGRKFGHNNIRSTLINVIPERMDETIKGLKSSKNLNEAAQAANKAFGNNAIFWLYQAALDVAWLYPHLVDRDSEPYFGYGSKNHNGDVQELQDYLNENKPDHWRYFYKFDVENALCEYRKYIERTENGIPKNRIYNGKN
jgi:hypothetical protein